MALAPTKAAAIQYNASNAGPFKATMSKAAQVNCANQIGWPPLYHVKACAPSGPLWN